MGPKRGRARAATSPTTASRRSRRGHTDPGLVPTHDDPEAQLRRGGARARDNHRGTGGLRPTCEAVAPSAGQQETEVSGEAPGAPTEPTLPEHEAPATGIQHVGIGQNEEGPAESTAHSAILPPVIPPAAELQLNGPSSAPVSPKTKDAPSSQDRTTDEAPLGAGQDGTRDTGNSKDESKGEKSGDPLSLKRASDGKAEGERDDKRPRAEDSGSGGGFQGPTTSTTPIAGTAPVLPSDPCRDFHESLRELHRRASAGPPIPLEREARVFEHLEVDSTISGAIAAVVVAIIEAGGPTFSLFDPMMVLGGRCIAHAGNDLIVPHAVGPAGTGVYRTLGGHIGLFIFRPAADGSFTAEHFDSSRRRTEAAARNQVQNSYNENVRMLTANGWVATSTTGAAEHPASPTHCPAPLQSQDWTCGLHAICTAWAHALGLQLNDTATMQPIFNTRAVEVVNFALRGQISAQTIRDFLACHNFITRNLQLPPDRMFAHTHAFTRSQHLTEYIARVRINEDLSRMRELDESIPDLDLIMTVLENRGLEIDAVAGRTAVELLVQYLSVLDALDAPAGDRPHDETSGHETLADTASGLRPSPLGRGNPQSDSDEEEEEEEEEDDGTESESSGPGHGGAARDDLPTFREVAAPPEQPGLPPPSATDPPPHPPMEGTHEAPSDAPAPGPAISTTPPLANPPMPSPPTTPPPPTTPTAPSLPSPPPVPPEEGLPANGPSPAGIDDEGDDGSFWDGLFDE